MGANFDTTQPIDVTGTYPLLKDTHGWSWQRAGKDQPFKHTKIVFTRPSHLEYIRQIDQGIFLWVSDEDLPLLKVDFEEALEEFCDKLKGPGLLVVPADQSLPDVGSSGSINRSRTAVLKGLPWRYGETTSYNLIDVTPKAPERKQRKQCREKPGEIKPPLQAEPSEPHAHSRDRKKQKSNGGKGKASQMDLQPLPSGLQAKMEQKLRKLRKTYFSLESAYKVVKVLFAALDPRHHYATYARPIHWESPVSLATDLSAGEQRAGEQRGSGEQRGC